MASPQLEDGYTKISNEILDNMSKLHLNGTEAMVLICIFRYTYGFNRKSHKLSASFIAGFANCSVDAVKKAIKHLKSENVILCINPYEKGVCCEWMFNKDYESWNVNQLTNVNQSSVQTSSSTSVQTYTQENKKRNKNLNKNIYEHFFEKAWKAYPKKKGKSAVSAKAKKEIYQAGEEKVIGAVMAYAREIEQNKTEDKFIMHGSTFFNGRWRDYVQEPREVTKEPDPEEEDEEPIDYSDVERTW